MIDPPDAEPLLKGILDQESEPVKRILDAAECSFFGAGYYGTSIRDIAAVAGVSKSVLHYHFQSKEHIFLEVQIRSYNRLAARVTEAVADMGSTAERGLFALDALFDVLRLSDDLPIQAELWARALTNDKAAAHVVRLREYLREQIIATVDRLLGSAWGLLPISKEATADLMLATMIGLGLQAGFDSSPERVEEALQGLRNLVGLALETVAGGGGHQQGGEEGDGDV